MKIFRGDGHVLKRANQKLERTSVNLNLLQNIPVPSSIQKVPHDVEAHYEKKVVVVWGGVGLCYLYGHHSVHWLPVSYRACVTTLVLPDTISALLTRGQPFEGRGPRGLCSDDPLPILSCLVCLAQSPECR